jgi:hypothetical protein
MLFNIVDPESGVTILFNIVDNCEQCGQQNIVQSYFHQLLKQPVLIVFNRVLSLHGLFYLYKNFDITFLTICLSWHTLSTSPVGRKPEHPEKTHDFRQSVFGRALTDSFHMSPWRESDPCTISGGERRCLLSRLPHRRPVLPCLRLPPKKGGESANF